MEFEDSNVPSHSNMAIPEDLIIEILSRLPVRSLLKFRSVSKSWLSLISGPEFIKKHLNLSANLHVLLLDRVGEKMNFKECLFVSLFDDSVNEALELDHPLHLVQNDGHSLDVHGSCNRLVYLSCYDCLEHFFLWNPTTRKHNKLPSFGPIGKEPYKTTFGFGYDELQDDYKVVIISFYDSDFGKPPDIEVKVYSLKTDSWTKVDYCDEETSSIKRIPTNFTASFVAVKLHWGTFIWLRRRGDIIAFDLSCEKWETLEKPSYGEEENEIFIGKLGSDLSIFTDYKTIHACVWVMKEYGVEESWIKILTINYPNHERYPYFSVSIKGEILFLPWATSMVYNSKDDSFKYLHITNCHKKQFVVCYLKSLVSPFQPKGQTTWKKPSALLLNFFSKCTCEGSS